MSLREALASWQATSKETPFHSLVIASEHNERGNQQAKNPPTKKQRITRKSVRKAMAKPQHSAALKIAIFDSPLLTNFRIPNKNATNQPIKNARKLA